MRLLRAKAARKTLGFYRAAFKLEAPYTLFVDGTFVHHALATVQTNLRARVEKVLGRGVRFAVPAAVLDELRSFGAAAEAIIDDAITTVDDLRDPRQRGRPSFAGCGRYDGTPGTFEVGDSAHKGCPELDMSGPLLPKSPFQHWDAMSVFKEY